MRSPENVVEIISSGPDIGGIILVETRLLDLSGIDPAVVNTL
jgi:hypothetical protein